MINQVNIIGRLTKDVEARAYYDVNNVEKSIAKFSIAVNDRSNEKTYYFDCSAFGKLAENIIRYCGKGSLVGISGELIQEIWEDKTAQKRSKVSIRVSECEFLSQKTTQEPTQEQIYNQYYNQQYVQPQPTQQYYYQNQMTQPNSLPNPNSALEALNLKPRNIEDEAGF